MITTHAYKSQMILTIAVLVFALFQLSQIMIDRGNLKTSRGQIDTRMAEVDKSLADNQKMLDQLNAIAVGTQRLADAGNQNAKDIVVQLGKAGIKINPNYKEDQQKAAAGVSPAATPPAAATPTAETPAATPAAPAATPAPPVASAPEAPKP